MKNIFFLLSLTALFSFIETEEIVFTNASKKIKITAADTWKAAGNMKGVEIFISRANASSGIPSTLVVSKDEGLLEGTTLNTYSAGQIFLQTAVFKTSISITDTKTIDGKKFKYFEYEYLNDDLVKMKSMIFHTLIGTTGYQMVITSEDAGFELNRPLYNQISSTFQITQ
jgi:hypothetical protein